MRAPSKKYFFVHLLVVVPVVLLLAAGARSTYRDFQAHERSQLLLHPTQHPQATPQLQRTPSQAESDGEQGLVALLSE